jgi:Zn-dependent M16 (insulinase) family peptidase
MCIVGGIGRLDAHLLPGAKGYASMEQYLCGESQQARQQFRDELLGTTARDFCAFADVLQCVQEQGSVVVMGSREALAEANAARGDWLRVTEIL